MRKWWFRKHRERYKSREPSTLTELWYFANLKIAEMCGHSGMIPPNPNHKNHQTPHRDFRNCFSKCQSKKCFTNPGDPAVPTKWFKSWSSWGQLPQPGQDEDAEDHNEERDLSTVDVLILAVTLVTLMAGNFPYFKRPCLERPWTKYGEKSSKFPWRS